MLPGGHPDGDVLADLAARVLPDHEARAVEAHVIGCARCANLLGDAERVRQLLLADDPGPMPGDVWLRITGLLSAESAQRSAAGLDAYTAHYAYGEQPYVQQPPVYQQEPLYGQPTPYEQSFADGLADPLTDPYPQPGAYDQSGAFDQPYAPAPDQQPYAAAPDQPQLPYDGGPRPPYDSGFGDGSYGSGTGWGQDEWFTQETPAVDGWTPVADPTGPADGGDAYGSATYEDAPTSQWTAFVEEGQEADQPDGGLSAFDTARRRRTDGHPDSHTDPRADHATDHRTDGQPDWGQDEDDDQPRRHGPGGRVMPLRSAGQAAAGAKRGRSLRTRRDVRQESKDDGGSRIGRFARPLGIAAGVVVLAGLGIAAVKIMPVGVDSTVSSAAAGSAVTAPEAASAAAAGAYDAAANVLSTGTDYTDKDLATKALALPAVAAKSAAAPAAASAQGSAQGSAAGGAAPAASAAPASSSAAGLAGASASPAAAATPVPGPTAPAAADSVRSSAKVTGNTSLQNPAALRACLAELGVKDAQPLAVDLATYQGRDAAIIVLAARDGGYEVWAVERTCAPGKGGQLAYKTVPPS